MVPDLTGLPIIDPSLRKELEMVGGVELHPRLVTMFIEEAETSQVQVTTALQTDDATLLARSAHRIKGGAAAIGARRIATLASALETSGRQDRLQDAPLLQTMLTAEIEALKSS